LSGLTASNRLRDIWRAGHLLEPYGAKFDKACPCLKKYRAVLPTYYSFLAEHWRHLRTTNRIVSSFATLHKQRPYLRGR
jgi:hypothetical protein